MNQLEKTYTIHYTITKSQLDNIASFISYITTPQKSDINPKLLGQVVVEDFAMDDNIETIEKIIHDIRNHGRNYSRKHSKRSHSKK